VTTGRGSAAVGASTSAPAHLRKRTMLNPYAASNKQGAAGGYRIEQAEGVHTSISETASRAQWTYSEQSLPDQLFTPFPFSMSTSYKWYLGRTPTAPNNGEATSTLTSWAKSRPRESTLRRPRRHQTCTHPRPAMDAPRPYDSSNDGGGSGDFHKQL